MHIVFKKVDEWFEKDPDLKRKFQDTYRMIYASAHKYAEHMEEVVKEKTNTSIKVEISEQLLKQALIDTFDDLLRLTNYHPTKEPNPIKEMAYIVYWLIRRKPIRLVSEDIIMDARLSDMARTRFLFINEERVKVSKEIYQEYMLYERKERYFTEDLKRERSQTVL